MDHIKFSIYYWIKAYDIIDICFISFEGYIFVFSLTQKLLFSIFKYPFSKYYPSVAYNFFCLAHSAAQFFETKFFKTKFSVPE